MRKKCKIIPNRVLSGKVIFSSEHDIVNNSVLCILYVELDEHSKQFFSFGLENLSMEYE